MPVLGVVESLQIGTVRIIALFLSRLLRNLPILEGTFHVLVDLNSLHASRVVDPEELSERVVSIYRSFLGDLVPTVRILEFMGVELVAVSPSFGCIEHHCGHVRVKIFEVQVFFDLRPSPFLDVASVVGVLRVYVGPSERPMYVRNDAS